MRKGTFPGQIGLPSAQIGLPRVTGGFVVDRGFHDDRLQIEPHSGWRQPLRENQKASGMRFMPMRS